MNRQEVVIALAKINMMNKQVAYWIDLDQDVDNITKAIDIDIVPVWKDEIIQFMKENPCKMVVNIAEKMYPIDYLKKCLKARSKKYQPITIQKLSKFAEAIEELYSYSSIYYKMYKTSPYGILEEPLANEKAAELLKRAIDAGYLDVNYFPCKGTTKLHLKAIAWGVGQQIGIKWRIQWVTFERQWKCERIGTIPLPECYSKDLEDVKKLYPEVDYSPLLKKKEDEFFKSPKDECRVEELFLALVAFGYIDRKSTYSQFRKAFGIKDQSDDNFVPVNWIRDQRNLTYFIHYTFRKTNKDIWVKTKNCFTVNGKTPNKGSLKSGFLAMKRNHPDIEKYDPCLITLAAQFNRKK